MTEHDEPGTEMDRPKELEAFKERQIRELREFEERHHPFEIKIDRTEFKVTEQHLTGAQLRLLPTPPIAGTRAWQDRA